MKLAFFTNIPSYHQIPLAKEFVQRLHGDYSMICWDSEIQQDRQILGWPTSYDFDWLIQVGNSSQQYDRAIDILRSADVVIWGYAPYREIRQRIQGKKMTFRYTERLFKGGHWRILSPRTLKSLWRYKLLDGPSHHLLAVGPHCAADFRLIGMFRKRIWRWGYFTDTPTLADLDKDNQVLTVLWAGRMIACKQVDKLLTAVQWVSERTDIQFRLQLIGYGPEEHRLRLLSTRLGIDGICDFLGPQPADKVIQAMGQASVFVFPSNYKEGWGAVVNEAMSCRCCVIASVQAGSPQWLIQHGVNGLHFDGKSTEELGKSLLYCLSNPSHRLSMGEAAQSRIVDLWSPAVAAERFLQLCTRLAQQEPSPYFDGGPCASG